MRGKRLREKEEEGTQRQAFYWGLIFIFIFIFFVNE